MFSVFIPGRAFRRLHSPSVPTSTWWAPTVCSRYPVLGTQRWKRQGHSRRRLEVWGRDEDAAQTPAPVRSPGRSGPPPWGLTVCPMPASQTMLPAGSLSSSESNLRTENADCFKEDFKPDWVQLSRASVSHPAARPRRSHSGFVRPFRKVGLQRWARGGKLHQAQSWGMQCGLPDLLG